MKKPTSKWAIAMWLAAAIFSLGEISSLVRVQQALSFQMSGMNWIEAIGTAMRHIFFYGAILVGLGVVIESLDQIHRQISSVKDFLILKNR